MGELEKSFHAFNDLIRMRRLVKNGSIPLIDDNDLVRRESEAADDARIVYRVLREDALQLQKHGDRQILTDHLADELHATIVVDDHPFTPVARLTAGSQ